MLILTFLYIFAADMGKGYKYRVLSVMLLLACVYMSAVKMFHHHHDLVIPSDCVCTLDGESLSDHEAHHHASYLPSVKTDNDCAICHFQIMKVQQTLFFVFLPFLLFSESHYSDYSSALQQKTADLRHSRAPPAMMFG